MDVKVKNVYIDVLKLKTLRFTLFVRGKKRQRILVGIYLNKKKQHQNLARFEPLICKSTTLYGNPMIYSTKIARFKMVIDIFTDDYFSVCDSKRRQPI